MHAPPPGQGQPPHPLGPQGASQPPGQPPGGYGGAPGAGFGPSQGPSKGGGGGTAIVIILVVVGVVVVMLGTLGVLAIFGVRKFIANAKTAEVRNSLGQIAKDSVSAYEGDFDSVPLKPDSRLPQPVGHRICPSASRPVPSEASVISGKKYQSAHGDWTVDADRNAGFACLRFEMTNPQYFQYRYEATATSFTGGGRGDLNGDGHFSDFQIKGQIVDTQLRVAPSLLETDPEE